MGWSICQQHKEIVTILTTRKATLSDVLSVTSNLRDEDIEETYNHTGMYPQDCVPFSVVSGYGSHLTIVDPSGKPIGLFGVSPHGALKGYGVTWMLLTKDIEKFSIQFLREGKSKYLDHLHADYRIIGNYVDANNHLHLNWLKWLGFSFLPLLERFGPHNKPFYPIIHVKD